MEDYQYTELTRAYKNGFFLFILILFFYFFFYKQRIKTTKNKIKILNINNRHNTRKSEH